MRKNLIAISALAMIASASLAAAATPSPLASAMAHDFAAYQARLSAAGVYEQRDDPSIQSVSEALVKIATAFEEYKKTNDQRIEAVKAGKGTAELDAKLARMDAHLDGMSEAKSRLELLEKKLARPGFAHGARQEGDSDESVAYKNAFFDWVRNPKDAEREQRAHAAQKTLEAKTAADQRETRAAQVTTLTGAAGGLAIPKIIETEIQRLSVDISPIRNIAYVRTVGTTDYHELYDVNGAGFEWLGETDTRNQTNTPDLKEIVPTFGMASAKPQASEESLDDIFFDVEAWLNESVSEALAAGEGAAFIAGNGVMKPTGFLAGPAPVTTADNARAFGTLQYFASGQAAAMPTNLDIFHDMVYGIRARYRTNAQWVTSKMVLSALRKYKDSTGQYLWQPALTAGQPATFLSYGITEAEDMPAVAANAFPLAFGNFREGYLITDRVGLRMTRDDITTPGFVKFYVRRRVGGCLRNTQAIKLLKIAAA